MSRQLDPAQGEPETAVPATARLVGATVATMLWASGCTQPPPPRPEIDLSQSIPASAEDVLARTESAVPSLGLSVVQVDPARGRLLAQGQDVAENTAWAQCAEPWVYDRDDGQRRRRAGVRELDLDLVLSTTAEPDGTLVTIRPRFERTYVNSFTNLEFTRRCRSTGALERQIFDRLQAP